MKTRKIVAKRFKVTKSGKFLHRHQGTRHLKKNKTQAQKLRHKKSVTVSDSFRRAIRTFLPYS